MQTLKNLVNRRFGPYSRLYHAFNCKPTFRQYCINTSDFNKTVIATYLNMYEKYRRLKLSSKSLIDKPLTIKHRKCLKHDTRYTLYEIAVYKESYKKSDKIED